MELPSIFRSATHVLGDSHTEVAQDVGKIRPSFRQIINLDAHSDLGSRRREPHDGNFLTHWALSGRVELITWVLPQALARLIDERGSAFLVSLMPEAVPGSFRPSEETGTWGTLEGPGGVKLEVCHAGALARLSLDAATWLSVDLDFFSSEDDARGWLCQYGEQLGWLCGGAGVSSLALSYECADIAPIWVS